MNIPPSDSAPQAGSARQNGIAALRAGDRDAARALLSAAVAHSPDDQEAWLWLSGAVSSDAERRYCLLRVQALNPAHPAAARGLAMLPDVPALDPLPGPPPAPVETAAAEPPPVAETPPAEKLWLPEPAPVPAAAPPSRPQWLFWGAVGGLSLALVILVGFIALRVIAGGAAEQRAAAAAVAPPAASPTAAPTAAPATAVPTPLPPSPTAAPPATPTSEPSATPAPPTAEPTAAPTAAAPGDDSAPALAARGLIRQRRDLDHEGALADYSEAVARDPEYADAYYLRAALRYELGDAEAGQADYVRALQLDSTSANALYLSGRVEISLGDEASGLDAYNKALRIDPNHAQAYYSRGVYKANQNDIQGAIDDYTAAIRADPKLAFAYGNRATLYDRSGRYDPAMERAALSDYAMAIELEPLYFQAYYNRGYAYRWYYDEPALALADFEMATRLRPTSATAHCELGNVRNHLGDPQGGLADTTRAIELDPEYACAYYTRGRIQNVLGRYAEAIADMSRYMELEPFGYRFTEALIERGYARGQSGDLEGGVADYTAVIERDPSRAVAYYHRSALYNLLGDYQAALDDMTIAVELYRQQGPADQYNRAAEKLRQLTESVQ